MATRGIISVFLRRALVAVLLGLAWPIAGLAASVLPLDLDTIIDGASLAYQGRCLDSRSERDATTGLIVTLTTFEVREPLKGSPPQTHTIKQIGGQVGDEVSRVDGVPAFAPGEDYVVFLYGVSEAGFSSPVGLSQGSFTVREGPSGRMVSNGRDFRELLPKLAVSELPKSVQAQAGAPQGRAGQMDLDEFKQLVRQRIRK